VNRSEVGNPSLNNIFAALASIFDLATVEVSSRVAEIEESWSIVVKGGDKIYAGPSLRWRRERPGTIVNIKDAFYNVCCLIYAIEMRSILNHRSFLFVE